MDQIDDENLDFDDFGEDDDKAEEEPKKISEVVRNVPPEEGDITIAKITVQENVVYDRDRYWLTFSTGLLYSRGDATASAPVALRAGFGMQFGFNIANKVFTSEGSTQDSLTLEGGLFFYKVLNLLEESDSYNVLPLIARARYNIMFTETFWIFLSGGFLKNVVISSTQGTASAAEFTNAQAALGSFIPIFGTGVIIKIGPQWHLRVDLGLDMVGGGLILRF